MSRINRFKEMTFSYGEIIPDSTIDIFYEKIRKCIEDIKNYDHYIRNLIKLNGNVPPKIQALISENG